MADMVDKADKGKKRKRNTDGISKPSKRVALDADKQVKISHHEADIWAPVIGMNISQLYFPLFCLCALNWH